MNIRTLRLILPCLPWAFTDPARKSLATGFSASPGHRPWAATPLAATLLAAGLLCLATLPGRAADGEVDPGFNPNADAAVHSMAVQTDGKILLGGAFTMVGGTARNYIARLNADGTLDPGFNPNADDTVYSMAVQADGKILLGGEFTMVGGTTRNGIARLNADGTIDSGFNPNADALVDSMAVQADGKILVAGFIFSVGATVPNYIARLNADGTLDPGFNPNASDSVSCLAIQADGKILLGGSFTMVGGVLFGRIARVNADGTFDAGFHPPLLGGTRGSLDSLAVQADGKILYAHFFSRYPGPLSYYIGRLNADGTTDPDFHSTVNGSVYSMAVQADGKILLGGEFTTVGGTARNRIARINADGTLDPGFNPNPGGSFSSVALQADGRILLGGDFTSVGGVARNRIARLLNEAATQALTVPNSGQVQWLRGGTAPEVEQVTFELSADSGMTWIPLGAGGTRIEGGWVLNGLSLPASGTIRARGRTTATGSSSLIEQVSNYALLPEFRITRFVRNGDGSFTIEWVGGGTLQVSATLADWQDVVGATSPYTVPGTLPKQFFRIRR